MSTEPQPLAEEIMSTCEHHGRLLDTMNRIEQSIEEIRESLIGTIDKQGFIGRVNSTMQKQDACIDDLMEWRSEMRGALRALSIKLVSVVVGFVTVGAVVAIAVIKFMVG